MKLNNRTDCIPGGFTFIHPQTGDQIGPEHSIGDLCKAVTEYNRANNFDPISEEQIEHQNCVRFPEYCRPSGNIADLKIEADRAERVSRIGPANVIQATKILGRWVLKGRKKADPALVAERVATCKKCPEHIGYEGCSSCTIGKIRSLVTTVVGKTEVLEAKNLKVCRVCGCALEAKVQLPLEFLQNELQRLPSNCWIVKETARKNNEQKAQDG